MVWPALLPPWNRTTMSARFDSQSMILPLPSSPHWAPITVTLDMLLNPYPDRLCPAGARARWRLIAVQRRTVRAKVPHPRGNAADTTGKSVKYVVSHGDDFAGVPV